MFPIATVVAVLDNSAEADSVLDAARAMRATDAPSMLHMVHVVEEMTTAMRRYLFPYACFGDDHDAIVADLLDAGRLSFRQRFEDDKSFDDRLLRVVYGRVADRILEELQRLGPDVVVVGASSSEHPEVGVIGKNAARLARRSTAPVLVVRNRTQSTYKNIGVAIDLTSDSASLLSTAIRFAHERDAKVTPIHVLPSSASLDHSSVRSKDVKALDSSTKRDLDRRFQQVLAALKLPFPVQSDASKRIAKPMLEQGDPGERLVAASRDEAMDLLIMYRCQSSTGSGLRLGRVAEYALRYASCDVLVLPPPIQQGED